MKKLNATLRAAIDKIVNQLQQDLAIKSDEAQALLGQTLQISDVNNEVFWWAEYLKYHCCMGSPHEDRQADNKNGCEFDFDWLAKNIDN